MPGPSPIWPERPPVLEPHPIRGHWGIENKSHYIRNTVYREDNSQAWTAEGPHALASLRNLTLGLFRLKNANSIKETTEWVCRDRMRALQFVTT